MFLAIGLDVILFWRQRSTRIHVNGRPGDRIVVRLALRPSDKRWLSDDQGRRLLPTPEVIRLLIHPEPGNSPSSLRTATTTRSV